MMINDGVADDFEDCNDDNGDYDDIEYDDDDCNDDNGDNVMTIVTMIMITMLMIEIMIMMTIVVVVGRGLSKFSDGTQSL